MNKKDFPHPLGVFIDEEVPVKKFNYDPEKKRVFSTYQMEKQKTMYIDAPKEKHRCKDGEHNFVPVNPKKGIFSCTKCTYSRQVYPTTYMFINGKLIHRITGKVI